MFLIPSYITSWNLYYSHTKILTLCELPIILCVKMPKNIVSFCAVKLNFSSRENPFILLNSHCDLEKLMFEVICDSLHSLNV